MTNTILGIDPGTKEMGMAVLRQGRLIGSGVHTLKSGSRPYDLIGQARRVLLSYIEEFAPDLVVIEAPLRLPTQRAALMSVIGQELHEGARDLHIRVVERTPQEVRQAVAGDPRASKIQLAEALVRSGFPELADRVPKRPARSALGLKPRDRYWLHLFDALGLAVAGGACPRVSTVDQRLGAQPVIDSAE